MRSRILSVTKVKFPMVPTGQGEGGGVGSSLRAVRVPPLTLVDTLITLARGPHHQSPVLLQGVSVGGRERRVRGEGERRREKGEDGWVWGKGEREG